MSKEVKVYGEQLYKQVLELLVGGYTEIAACSSSGLLTHLIIVGDVFGILIEDRSFLDSDARRTYAIEPDGHVRRHLAPLGQPTEQDLEWRTKLVCACDLEYLLDVISSELSSSRREAVRS